MGEILVKRAIDRSRYPKTMMYVDKQGNICKADRPRPLSAEEKAVRKEARDKAYQDWLSQKRKLRKDMLNAKKEAKKHPSVASALAYEQAQEDYNDYKEEGFHRVREG